MRQIQSFNVIQTSKVLGALYFVLGLAIGLSIAIMSVATARGSGRPGLLMAALTPFLYGAAGFVFTAIFCCLYNLIARRLGGIEVEVTG